MTNNQVDQHGETKVGNKKQLRRHPTTQQQHCQFGDVIESLSYVGFHSEVFFIETCYFM